MTRWEYMECIEYAIKKIEEREKTMAARYIELNPQDKERRERDMDSFLLGLYEVRQEISRRVKID